MQATVAIVLRCRDELVPKARYVFDSLLLAAGIPAVYVSRPPSSGVWLAYGAVGNEPSGSDRCVVVPHCPEAWEFLCSDSRVAAGRCSGAVTVLPHSIAREESNHGISFDLVANAFFVLTSWHERHAATTAGTRQLFSSSIYSSGEIPSDVVDGYLKCLVREITKLCDRRNLSIWSPREWPSGASHAVVLSHDVDFIPSGLPGSLAQGARTVMRHLVRQHRATDALKAATGLVRALVRGRDPYGCIPDIVSREKAIGVRSSFQVAVARRHPNDVNYSIEDDRIRDYLRVICDEGFDLCLHGSYRSTENPQWYIEEAELLERRLARPSGSRQHFLSFDYSALFEAQERAGIRYDMSMGFPDRIGPRAGFSFPYFPYCVERDRPFGVVEISLFLMDVTLQSYMRLGATEAWAHIEGVLDNLRLKRGAISIVWHPIVFGGARDPGYDRLYWQIIEYVQGAGGLATDGRTINDFWRNQARQYDSFEACAT